MPVGRGYESKKRMEAINMKKLAAFLALIILVMSVCTVGIGETETP